MIGRKLKYEVVSESAYTDFSDRYEEKKGPSNGVLLTAATAATASLATYTITKYTNPTTIAPPIPLPTEAVSEPASVLASTPDLSPVFSGELIGTPDNMIPYVTQEIIPTGLIGDKATAAFATIFDPIVDLVVAISLPLASVVVAAAGLLLIIGNSEKAQSMIIKAGLGYVAVQLLPLFISILKTMGKAVAG